MTTDGFVFVHGGQHDARCWQPTLDALQRLTDLPALAVNLPGRNGEPGNLGTLTIAQCAESVCRQIADHQLSGRLTLVGHSMAGISLPAIAALLGEQRLHSLVFMSCCIPEEGRSIIDSLDPPMSIISRLAAHHLATMRPMPGLFAKWVFGNGMTAAQKRYLVQTLCREATSITSEAVSRQDMPPCPRHWIMLEQDRALSPARQKNYIDNLGGVDSIEYLNCCHDAMIAEPEQVAATLVKLTVAPATNTPG